MVKVNQKVGGVLCAIYPPFIRHLSDIFSGLGTDIRHLCAIYAPPINDAIPAYVKQLMMQLMMQL
jgi:hypothetical protein